jgi:hypothetical protein
MDGSNNDQVGVSTTAMVAKGSAVLAREPGTTPTAVLTCAPTTTATAKGPAAPVTGPVRALMLAAKKGRLTGG